MPKPLPTSARARVDAADPRGTLDALQVRPARRAPVVATQAWDLDGAADHGRSAQRAVTLIQAEHLPAIAALLGRPVDFPGTRRNLLVSGINLEVCVGRPLVIGEVVLELTVRCHPCRRMDETFGVGGFAAMYGHGGWCARIVRSGVLRVGDGIRLADVPQQGLFDPPGRPVPPIR
jgi:MOSC domain-containing protein YiiM